MQRVNCGSCGSDNIATFLDLGKSPIADAYTREPNGTSKTYPLQIGVCTSCFLMQLTYDIPDHELFNSSYSFYSSASAPLSAYHRKYAYEVMRNVRERSRVLEIGCNDGDMLQHFAIAGHDAHGIDPASGPAALARSRGLNVREEPFTLKTAESYEDKFDVVIANHVLAHVSNVADFVTGIATVLADNGVAYIEVQYAPDLLLNNAFDLAYHEHRNFFSLAALDRALNFAGLTVIDAITTDRQGGALRAIVRHVKQFDPVPASLQRLLASEHWLQTFSSYAGFQGRVERVRDRLLTEMADIRKRDGLIVGYGAPAKATTLLNFCGLTCDTVASVLDTTVAKHNRYIPGTDIMILPPEESATLTRDDAYLLLAWNYTGSILRKHVAETTRGVRWIVPIPVPVVL